jgi:hypothetical protein
MPKRFRADEQEGLSSNNSSTGPFAGQPGNDAERSIHRNDRSESDRYTFSVAFFFSRSVANSTVP